jgi:pimeloyl-ACP methyl ester carboxylesterase
MTTLAQPKSVQVSVNGLELRYLDWSNAGATPVVCVHGYILERRALQWARPTFARSTSSWPRRARPWGERVVSPTARINTAIRSAIWPGLVDQLGLTRFVLIGTSMGGIIAMAYAQTRAERLLGLVISDIGPDVEGGNQRITQMVGARPEEFTALEDAMAYRREISPVTASRPISDQRELALGVLRQRPDGRWVWKMDPAHIRQRVSQHGAPPRPRCGAVLRSLACPTMVVWGTESDVPRGPGPSAWWRCCREVNWSRCPAWHAPTLVEPVVLTALERSCGQWRRPAPDRRKEPT